MIIEPSAHKHGIREVDIRHALRNHWRRIETDDVAVALFIGPSTTGQLLEIAVVHDEDGTAIIHAMVARRKFLEALP